MTIETDTRDRTIRLEAQVEHLSSKLDAVSRQVAEMHELLTQAKGAKWALITLVTFGNAFVGVAGFIAAKSYGLIDWAGGLPK